MDVPTLFWVTNAFVPKVSGETIADIQTQLAPAVLAGTEDIANRTSMATCASVHEDLKENTAKWTPTMTVFLPRVTMEGTALIELDISSVIVHQLGMAFAAKLWMKTSLVVLAQPLFQEQDLRSRSKKKGKLVTSIAVNKNLVTGFATKNVTAWLVILTVETVRWESIRGSIAQPLLIVGMCSKMENVI